MADFPDKFNYSRLYAQLDNSRLQTTNNPLWVTIKQLIKASENFSKFSNQQFPGIDNSSSTTDLIAAINTIIEDIKIINANGVTGPATAVNNDIAVFDGTTGKIIKDSGVTIASLTAGFDLTPTFLLMGA